MKKQILCLILVLMIALSGCTTAAPEKSISEVVSAVPDASEITYQAESEIIDESAVYSANEQSESADDSIIASEHSQHAPDPNCITQSEFEHFVVTVKEAHENAVGFRDFDETMHSSFLGTWYDPELGEAIRLTEEAAYVYIPYLDCYGDIACPWELIDRSEEGKCPKLSIYCFGKDGPALVYYVAGNTGDFFWCVSQGQLFYRQE